MSEPGLRKRLLATSCGLGLVVGFAPTVASGQSLEELEQRLLEQEAQIQQQEAEMESLRQMVEEMRAAEGAQQAESGAVVGRDSVVVDYDSGPVPTIEFYDAANPDDPKFDFKVRGRIQADVGYVGPQEGDTEEDFATELRRARLGVEGTAWYDWGYKFEVDFADNEVSIADALIEYNGLGAADLTLGQYKTPNSLDEQTSSRHITFIERAAFTDAFELDRRIGFGADGKYLDGDGTWAAGLFGQNAGDSGNLNEGYALAGRATYAFGLGEPATESQDKLVHVGGSVRFRDLQNNSDGSSVRYRQRPVAHTTSRRFVDTGTLEDVRNDVFVGPELALVYDRWSVQSEGGWTFVDQKNADTGTLVGAYIDGSYFLTPNSRRYSGGKFDRLKFQDGQALHEGGIGAWQLGFRLDYLNLTDTDAGIDGGEQISFIPAINWWPNRHVRFWLDYAYSIVNGGPEDLNGANRDNEIHAAVFRAQADF